MVAKLGEVLKNQKQKRVEEPVSTNKVIDLSVFFNRALIVMVECVASNYMSKICWTGTFSSDFTGSEVRSLEQMLGQESLSSVKDGSSFSGVTFVVENEYVSEVLFKGCRHGELNKFAMGVAQPPYQRKHVLTAHNLVQLVSVGYLKGQR